MIDKNNFVKCVCGSVKMGAKINYDKSTIELICCECEKLVTSRGILYKPLEAVRVDIIDLLKYIYENDTKAMSKVVYEDLKVTKVTQCFNLELLKSCYEKLYKVAENKDQKKAQDKKEKLERLGF